MTRASWTSITGITPPVGARALRERRERVERGEPDEFPTKALVAFLAGVLGFGLILALLAHG